jgi:hypothetical protein
VLAAVGFVLGRILTDDGGTEADQPSLIDQLDQSKTQEAKDATEHRFVGEKLGIYIAPSRDQLPREVWEEDVELSSAGCVPTSIDNAASLDFTDPLRMSAAFALSEMDSANTGTNPWALSCGGVLRSRGWDYTATGPQGTPATLSIVRTTTTYDTQEVAESRVSIRIVGGREAVVIEPLSPDGLAQRTLIYFPEPFGKTSIHAFNLPEADVLKVAEAVAEASQ